PQDPPARVAGEPGRTSGGEARGDERSVEQEARDQEEERDAEAVLVDEDAPRRAAVEPRLRLGMAAEDDERRDRPHRVEQREARTGARRRGLSGSLAHTCLEGIP